MPELIRPSAKVRYDEGCLAAYALNLVGDRWALLVVRELMFEPKRFQAMRAGLPGITAGVLVGRLAQLAEAGVVVHDPVLGTYTLTAAGSSLLPVLKALCHWGVQQPGHDPRRFISPCALMISMDAMFDRRQGKGTGTAVTAGFDLGAERFQMHLADGQLHTKAVRVADGDFVLTGSGNALAAAVYGPVPLAQRIDEGAIELRGNLRRAQRFVDRFRLDVSRSTTTAARRPPGNCSAS